MRNFIHHTIQCRSGFPAAAAVLSLCLAFTSCGTSPVSAQEEGNGFSGKLQQTKPTAPYTIYLSFDDGPNPGTPVVQQILHQEKVPATFFLVGLHATGSAKQHRWYLSLKQDTALELANHSFTHAWRTKSILYYQHPDSVAADFVRNQAYFQFNNRIARAPGSNIWRIPGIRKNYIKERIAAGDSIAAAGFQVLGWDTEWRYNGYPGTLVQTAQRMYTEIDSMLQHKRTQTPNHIVVLMHDATFLDVTDSTRLHQLIRQLKQSGHYHFALCSAYPALQQPAKSEPLTPKQ